MRWLLFLVLSSVNARADLLGPNPNPIRLGEIRAIEFPTHWKDFGFLAAKNCAQIVAYREKTGERVEKLEISAEPCPAPSKSIEKPLYRFGFIGNVAEGSTDGGMVVTTEGRRRRVGGIAPSGKNAFRLYDFCDGPKASACDIEFDGEGRIASVELKNQTAPKQNSD